MKKKGLKRFLFFLVILSVFVLKVNAASDYYKNINVTFNHNGCNDQANREITIQLFADGKKVENTEVTLNPQTGYSHTYENVIIFKPNSAVEYKYDVRYLEDGEWKLLSKKSYTYDKEHISKWVQIIPEEIKEGHTYVITTDNWNQEQNGFSKTIYLRGDVTAKGAPVVAEYNIVNGQPSYYVLDGEPIENTKWTVSKVPTDDPDYETFKDYLMFTNEGGKKLTLTGYRNGENINFIYKYSGKNGYIESEDAMYTNKVTLTNVPNSKGRFYIGTKNLWPEPNNMMQYVTLSGQNQYQAGSNMDRGAQFKAFEYVDMDVERGVTVNVEGSLCKKDTVVIDTDTEFKKTIKVDFDCSSCKKGMSEKLKVQLFANNKKVEDETATLSKSNDFTYTFKNLPVFDSKNKEIKYEVKVLNEGTYYSLPIDNENSKTTIKRWMQVLPSDIKAGHTYIIATENLNYQSNGFSRYVYLRGDITAKGANIQTEYNNIDNKKTYYILDGEPIENTKWVVSNVPSSDPNYDTFKNYLMFTNEEDKKLALTGYINGEDVNFIYKRSSKDGFVDSENAMYTNKVQIIPVEGGRGTFNIGTKNLLPEPNNMMQYLQLNTNNQYVATPNKNNAQEFVAYEYVEEDVILSSKVVLKPALCEVLEKIGKINPQTGDKNQIIYLFALLSGILFIVTLIIDQKRSIIKF